MPKTILALVTLAVLVPGTVPAAAQSAAELLEKGIYLEETAGQLEQAIEVYRRIVTDATADRAHVAEVLLRLGTCHFEQGDSEAATEAFERLLAEYPEQEPLVARAREHLRVSREPTLELLPAPWPDGEVMRMSLQLASGTQVGTLLMTADAAERAGEELWRLRIRHTVFSAPGNQTLRQVLVRRDDMAPLESSYRYPGVGHFEARYGDSTVDIDTVGTGASRQEKLEGPTFDAEEMYHLYRRLPLEVGAKWPLRVISTMAGAAAEVEVEVTGKETITVPAGELECYRVETAAQHVFWYSTGPSRVLVRLEAMGLAAELEEVYVLEPGAESVRSFDLPAAGESGESSGFDLTLPPDWLAYRHQAYGRDVVYLLDPSAETQTNLEIRRPRDDGDNCSSLTAAHHRLDQVRTELSDYQLRDGAWSEREVGGWPAVSFAGNYRGTGGEMVDDRTLIEHQEFCVEFTFKASAARFEALRAAFDRILDGYRGPPAVTPPESG